MRAKATGGRLVNVSARTAAVPTGGSVAYITAKAAVSALVRALADELADERILVNGILPATIDTPANRAAMPDADPGKWTKPADDRGADRLAGLARADGGVGRADPGRLVVASLAQFATSVTLSMQTVPVPAFENVNARPVLMSLLGDVKVCVKVCRLLLRPLLPSKSAVYGGTASATLAFTVPDPDA